MFNYLLSSIYSFSGVLLDAAAAQASSPEASGDLEKLKSVSLNDLIDGIARSLVSFAINLAIALLVFYVGKFIINKLYRFVSGLLMKKNVDRSITSFVLSLIRIVLYFILIVTVIGILGVETSSFIAIFASAGVAVGMALSGTLQNFAGGVLILLLKPYKVGDYIEVQGYAGTVREIQIFSTIISTPDNKLIIIPNGGLSTGSVNNWSKESFRRVDWTVAISYGDDVDVARTEILRMLDECEGIVKKKDIDADSLEAKEESSADENVTAPADSVSEKRSVLSRIFRRKPHIHHIHTAADESLLSPRMPANVAEPSVVLKNLGDSAVELKVSAWTRTTDYWSVYYRMNEIFYKQLPLAGISFPFPQLDVHIAREA